MLDPKVFAAGLRSLEERLPELIRTAGADFLPTLLKISNSVRIRANHDEIIEAARNRYGLLGFWQGELQEVLQNLEKQKESAQEARVQALTREELLEQLVKVVRDYLHEEGSEEEIDRELIAVYSALLENPREGSRPKSGQER